jgi:hypothetical protein
VRHSYLSVLGKGDSLINQDLKAELDRQFQTSVDQINSTLKHVSSQINQVQLQISQFKDIQAPTEEQRILKDQAYSQVNTMFALQDRKFGEHKDKFNRFLRETKEALASGNKVNAEAFKF